MDEQGAWFVYVTVDTAEAAERIARGAVERRLAACGNILPGATSVYWWEGAVQTGAEVVLVLKTWADRVDALVQAVREDHPYTCPCVVAWPIERGAGAFLAWIQGETRPGGGA